MDRLMVEENKRRKEGGEELLGNPQKPCEYFDLIGGTSTGGCAALYVQLSSYYSHVRIYILQDNCSNAWASSAGCTNGNRPLQ